MNPLLGIYVIIWIIRAISNGNGSQSHYQKGNANGKSLDITPSFIALVLKIFVFLMLGMMAKDSGHAAFIIAIWIVFLIASFPTLLLNRIIVPLGMPRLAYCFFRCTWPFGYGKETALGAVFYGALALARRDAKPKQVDWLIDWLMLRLPRESSNHVVYDIVLGLFAALNGEREIAQSVFRAFDDHHATQGLDKVRITVRDWLVMDAARRGDWQEVILRGRRGLDSHRWSYTVARLAERLEHSPQTLPNWQLWVLWLWAPRRLKLLPFVRQALATPWVEQEQVTDPAIPKDLPAALANLAAMLKQVNLHGNYPTRDDFLFTIRWTNIRLESPMLHTQMQERLQALGSLTPGHIDTVIHTFREQLTKLVTAIIERAPQLVQGERERPVIKEAIAAIQQAGFQDLEAHCRDYVNRTERQHSFNIKEEWHAWARLRASAERLLAIAPDAEDAVFQTIYIPLCNFAVFQHNGRSRHRLAYDMFLWLSGHAQSNPVALELLEKNLAIPLSFQLQRPLWLWKNWALKHWLALSIVIGMPLIFMMNRPDVPAPQPPQEKVAQLVPRTPVRPAAVPMPPPMPQIAPSNGPAIPAEPAPPSAAPAPQQIENNALPLPQHGGQVLGRHWLNYEIVIKGRTVSVYLTEQDHNFDLEGAAGYISYRQMQPPMIRKFDLVPHGKDMMSVTIPETPFEPGDEIRVFIAPQHHAESHFSLEVPGPEK